jgi:uncharacterized protein (TIGR02271 family)
MRQTVVGVFDRYAQAQHAAQQLRESGFGDSVYVTEDVEGSTGSSAGTTTAPERRDEGVLASVRHFFSDLFGNDDDREVGPYAEAVRRGGAVVKVEVDEDNQADAARSALEAAGAIDIDERAQEWRASGWDEGTSLRRGSASGSDASLSASGTGANLGGTARTTAGPREGDVIPVVREEVQVGKRLVSTGGVRVYAHTVTEPVHESVELRSEHAEVERRQVDRPAGSADLDALGDRTIEVRETAERPVVAKEARVVEEVRVGKKVKTRTEDISDSVRHTEVEVENLDGESATRDFNVDAHRAHWQSNYAVSGGTWDEYEPAYRYGHSMRSDSRYSGRDWAEVEPDARRDWESQHQGSAWERFKAAVRHGWDRMTD